MRAHSVLAVSVIRGIVATSMLVMWTCIAVGQRISCPDGERYKIDLNEVTLQYNATSVSAIIGRLIALGGRIQIDQKKLQEAASATQQWDIYLKGLAAGYNVCAITKQQYYDGLQRIYPLLERDASDLESLRKLIAEGQKADRKRFQDLVDSLLVGLREFRKISEQGDDVQKRGLSLYKQIVDFLAERNCGPGPPISIVKEPPQDSITPPCMAENRRLFVEKFEASVVALHDEFSSRGLQGQPLESIYMHLPGMSGNVDREIGEVANSIRELAMLVPPSDLFRDVTDQQLVATALDEARVMDEKVAEAMRELPLSSTPNGVRYHFSMDFSTCCLNQVEYLRAEMLKRLGSPAFDTDEMHAFNGSLGLTEIGKEPTAAIGAVANYAPYLRRLAIKLKHKSTPPHGPQVLTFSEEFSPDGGRYFPYQTTVTVKVFDDIRSGYVVVAVQGKPGTFYSDLEGGRLVYDKSGVIDNKRLSEILANWNEAKPVYVLQLGSVPITKDRPLHLFLEGSSQSNVLNVLYFEE